MTDQSYKTAVFSVRMTDAEKALARRAAEIAGEDGSNWARRVLLRAARERLQNFLDEASQEPSGRRQASPERAVRRE